MANNSVGELRRSAVISTYAPGAIADMRAEGGPVSGVSAGLEEWDSSAGELDGQRVIDRRLCKKLGREYFRLPPVLDQGSTKGSPPQQQAPSLVLRRFPVWLQCPQCCKIKPASKWGREPGRASRYCPKCSAKLPGSDRVLVVPVRFATACTAGHLDDFPWHWWVHHRPGCEHKGDLTLASKGAGLAGLVLSCSACGAMRSLDGAFGKEALKGLVCKGKRPWLRTDDASCNRHGDDGGLRVVQRGASNLYYPITESALDIPPWSGHLERLLGDCWATLEEIPDRAERIQYISIEPRLKAAVQRAAITPAELADLFEKRHADFDSVDTSDLRPDEYKVFVGGITWRHPDFEIQARAAEADISPYFGAVVRAARLREVRVVKGFTRINPVADPAGADFAPLSVSPLKWLPAIEVRGEGVFLQFRSQALREWEDQPAVIARAAAVDATWTAEWKSRFPEHDKPFDASPRLLLIHTFAHALIHRLTIECGYSTASLRERLYVSEGEDGMAGVLIYTATPDSDGTLGGLQGRARSGLLEETVRGALIAMRWCASDPLCISGEMAAPDAHSVASCHSCVMAPETSCEHHNRFLDRGMLVGTDAQPGIGYFAGLIGTA